MRTCVCIYVVSFLSVVPLYCALCFCLTVRTCGLYHPSLYSPAYNEEPMHPLISPPTVHPHVLINDMHASNDVPTNGVHASTDVLTNYVHASTDVPTNSASTCPHQRRAWIHWCPHQQCILPPPPSLPPSLTHSLTPPFLTFYGNQHAHAGSHRP
jgi:hypothetical protein